MYRKLPGEGALSQLHIPLLDINPEGKLEKEIKDIVEELGIMIYIKKREREVLGCFVGHASQILDPGSASATPKGPGTPNACRPEEPSIHQGESDSQTATSSTKTESESPHEPKDAEEVRAAGAEAGAAKTAHDWFGNNANELLKRVDQRIEQLMELERSAKSTAGMVSFYNVNDFFRLTRTLIIRYYCRSRIYWTSSNSKLESFRRGNPWNIAMRP